MEVPTGGGYQKSQPKKKNTRRSIIDRLRKLKKYIPKIGPIKPRKMRPHEGRKTPGSKSNRAFLKELLKEDVVVEEAIPCWLIGSTHFDLRLLVSFDKVLYMYPRCNTASNVTTNISQGATSKTMAFLKGVRKDLIIPSRLSDPMFWHGSIIPKKIAGLKS